MTEAEDRRAENDASYQVGYLDGYDAAKKQAAKIAEKHFNVLSGHACRDAIRDMEPAE